MDPLLHGVVAGNFEETEVRLDGLRNDIVVGWGHSGVTFPQSEHRLLLVPLQLDKPLLLLGLLT